MPLLSRYQIDAMERLYPNRLRVMEGSMRCSRPSSRSFGHRGSWRTPIFFSSDNGFHMGQHASLRK